MPVERDVEGAVPVPAVPVGIGEVTFDKGYGAVLDGAVRLGLVPVTPAVVIALVVEFG